MVSADQPDRWSAGFYAERDKRAGAPGARAIGVNLSSVQAERVRSKRQARTPWIHACCRQDLAYLCECS